MKYIRDYLSKPHNHKISQTSIKKIHNMHAKNLKLYNIVFLGITTYIKPKFTYLYKNCILSTVNTERENIKS